MQSTPVRRSSRLAPLLPVCLLAFPLLLGGCGDTTGPEGGIQVQITAGTPAPFIGLTHAGTQITCDIDISAKATGTRGAHAAWGEAVLRFAYGFDRQSFSETVRVSASEVRSAWGSGRIEVGQIQHSHWSVWADLPFTVQVEHLYRPNGSGQPRRSAVQFDCGPPPPASGAAAPTVGEVVVSPSGSTLEVGYPSVLTVTYTVSGTAGLWESGVEVFGAFSHVERRKESFSGQATHTVEIPVPAAARLGERVWIRAYAVDIAGQVGTSPPVTGPTLVDTTPPTLHHVWLSASWLASWTGLRGQFAASDTLQINVSAWDNHRLDYIVYRLGAPVNIQDSIYVADTPPQFSGSYRIDIPLREEWAGTPTLTVYARDASGLKSIERTSHPDSFHIYPVRQRSLRSVEIAGGFGDVIHDPARDRLYLTMPETNRIERISLGTMTRETLATLPGRPVGLDIAPDGRTLVAALETEQALAVIDLSDASATPRIVPFAATSEGFRPYVVRFAATGRALIVASGPGRVRIVEFDPASDTQTVRWDEQMNLSDTAAGARALDGSRIAFYLIDGCGVIVYEAATDAFTPCRQVETRGPLSASADGRRFAKGNTVYGSQLETIRNYPELSWGSGLSADGSEFFFGTWRGLIRSSVAAYGYTERIPFPALYDGRIIHARDGALLVAVGREVTGPGTFTTRVITMDLD